MNQAYTSGKPSSSEDSRRFIQPRTGVWVPHICCLGTLSMKRSMVPPTLGVPSSLLLTSLRVQDHPNSMVLEVSSYFLRMVELWPKDIRNGWSWTLRACIDQQSKMVINGHQGRVSKPKNGEPKIGEFAFNHSKQCLFHVRIKHVPSLNGSGT